MFLYQQFQESEDTPKRLKMEVVKKAFPFMSESVSRKILKTCADFKREGEWPVQPAGGYYNEVCVFQVMRMVGGCCAQTSDCPLMKS